MDDFMKSLQGLSSADLSALGVTAPVSREEEARKASGKTARRRGTRTTTAPSAPHPHAEEPMPDKLAAPMAMDLPNRATAKAKADTTSATPPASFASPASTTPPVPTTPADTEPLSTPPVPPARQRPSHEWPAVGALLQADYFGTAYQAEVVAANKLLKSGKQLKLLDGPARGKRFDSFSRAMLAATAHQRKTMSLARRGMSSGWAFWRVVTTSTPSASKASSSPTSKPAR